MNRKFVFESFQEFLNFANSEAINEASMITSFTELQTFLSSNGMDEAGLSALSNVDELAEKTGQISDYNFSPINNVLEKLTKPNTTEITGITVDVKDIDYSNLIGGAALTNKSKTGDLQDAKSGERIDVSALLGYINRWSLKGKGISYDKDKKIFEPYTDKNGKFSGDSIRDTGAIDQYCLIANKGSLDFVLYKENAPVSNWAAKPENVRIDPINFKEAKKNDEAGTWSGTYIFYYPTKMETGKGSPYTSTELVEIVRPVAKKVENLKPIVIQNDDVLFDVDKSVLREEGKVAILNALSNVTAAKTIEVTGGASIEGTRERNEELCKERAQAVADFLKAGAFKNAEVTINPKADIQESGEIDPTRRRVILDVVGQQLVSSTETGTETVISSQEAAKNADLLTVRQVAINIEGKFI